MNLAEPTLVYLVMCWRRWGSRRRRSWLARHCVRFHQLDASPVGVIDVHLALLIDAGGDFQLLTVVLEGRSGFKNLDRLRNVWHHKRDVILSAELVRRIAVEHELHIDRAV